MLWRRWARKLGDLWGLFLEARDFRHSRRLVALERLEEVEALLARVDKVRQGLPKDPLKWNLYEKHEAYQSLMSHPAFREIWTHMDRDQRTLQSIILRGPENADLTAARAAYGMLIGIMALPAAAEKNFRTAERQLKAQPSI